MNIHITFKLFNQNNIFLFINRMVRILKTFSTLADKKYFCTQMSNDKLNLFLAVVKRKIVFRKLFCVSYLWNPRFAQDSMQVNTPKNNFTALHNKQL